MPGAREDHRSPQCPSTTLVSGHLRTSARHTQGGPEPQPPQEVRRVGEGEEGGLTSQATQPSSVFVLTSQKPSPPTK